VLQLLAGSGYRPADVGAVAVCSGVPALSTAAQELAQRHFGRRALLVGPGVRTGMRLRYDNPKEIGADRIAGAVAAHHLHGAPLVLVDFGTAVTYEVLSPEGEYLGGAIAPGVDISADALFARAARLWRVDLTAPASAIGRNTQDAMRSGIVYGFVAQVDGMIERLWGELGTQAKVVATGGHARLMAGLCKHISVVERDLTLIGLRLLYELNQEAETRRPGPRRPGAVESAPAASEEAVAPEAGPDVEGVAPVDEAPPAEAAAPVEETLEAEAPAGEGKPPQ
jgi:type III pantothenate kinase